MTRGPYNVWAAGGLFQVRARGGHWRRKILGVRHRRIWGAPKVCLEDPTSGARSWVAETELAALLRAGALSLWVRYGKRGPFSQISGRPVTDQYPGLTGLQTDANLRPARGGEEGSGEPRRGAMAEVRSSAFVCSPGGSQLSCPHPEFPVSRPSVSFSSVPSNAGQERPPQNWLAGCSVLGKPFRPDCSIWKCTD